MINGCQITEWATDTWIDAGYCYSVTWERDAEGIVLDVSRVLAEGRGSPLAGRKHFRVEEGPALVMILGWVGSARTELVDEIIHGGAISVTEIVRGRLSQSELW